MSYRNWQNSFSARLRRAEWNLKHGRSVLNHGQKLSTLNVQRSTSKSEPAPQPPALPDANNGAAAASTLPAAAASPAVGQSRAKLGLRYER